MTQHRGGGLFIHGGELVCSLLFRLFDPILAISPYGHWLLLFLSRLLLFLTEPAGDQNRDLRQEEYDLDLFFGCGFVAGGSHRSSPPPFFRSRSSFAAFRASISLISFCMDVPKSKSVKTCMANPNPGIGGIRNVLMVPFVLVCVCR